MTIYRGPGGGGDATTDSELTALAAIAQEAAGYADEAAASATEASDSATAAAASAASAASSASAAATSASNSASSASAASSSASSAATSATNSANSATAAASSATSASSSASAASTSASNAATSATNAANSATAAAASATTADAAAVSASSSASAAYTSASNAASSASAAASSASAAAGSATAAAGSATSASNSASAAAASATSAANSATAADASADAAAQSVIDATAVLASSLLKANNLSDVTNTTTARTNIGAAKSGANSDITSLSGITGGISTADYLDIDTAATPAGAVGRVNWDDGNGTAVLGLKGGNVSLKVGQELVARVYNDSGSTLTKGQVVYISGAQGNRVAVKLALATSDATSAGTLGFVMESIAAGAEGFVSLMGTLAGLNTSSLTAGALIYLSATTAGAYTTTAPTAPNHRVTLGYVERVHATVGSIYVKVDNGYELEELHNVLISAPVNGQALVYNSSTGVWTNSTVDTLPSQTGNAGKYLTTNGTAASWATINTDANSTTKGLYEHSNTISANYTIASGNNAGSFGPITVASGVTVTVPSGSTWTVI